MSEKAKLGKELFKKGYNCSQAVMGAFCEEAGMDFDTAVKLSSSFGGGMGRMREVCGAVSAMFMIAGLTDGYTDPTLENKKEQYKLVQSLAEEFKAKNGSIICRELISEEKTSFVPEERTKEYYKKRPCSELVADACEIMEKYLKTK